MRDIVIVDIDGTISKLGDRLNDLKKGDWETFYSRCVEDEPYRDIISLVEMLSQQYEIIFCTGRVERVRRETFNWINEYTDLIIDMADIIMRPDGNREPDEILKLKMVKEADIDFRDIYLVLEDRNSMVKAWRKAGVRCLQVADGDF